MNEATATLEPETATMTIPMATPIEGTDATPIADPSGDGELGNAPKKAARKPKARKALDQDELPKAHSRLVVKEEEARRLLTALALVDADAPVKKLQAWLNNLDDHDNLPALERVHDRELLDEIVDVLEQGGKIAVDMPASEGVDAPKTKATKAKKTKTPHP
jgi:hypothetical protein